MSLPGIDQAETVVTWGALGVVMMSVSVHLVNRLIRISQEKLAELSASVSQGRRDIDASFGGVHSKLEQITDKLAAQTAQMAVAEERLKESGARLVQVEAVTRVLQDTQLKHAMRLHEALSGLVPRPPKDDD